MPVDKSTWRLPEQIAGGFHRDDLAEDEDGELDPTVLHKTRAAAAGQIVKVEVHLKKAHGGEWGILTGPIRAVWPDGRLEVVATPSTLDAPGLLDGSWDLVLRYYESAYDDGPWMVESMQPAG